MFLRKTKKNKSIPPKIFEWVPDKIQDNIQLLHECQAAIGNAGATRIHAHAVWRLKIMY